MKYNLRILNLKQRHLGQKGLTLIELLVVVSISGLVLATLLSIATILHRHESSSLSSMDVIDLKYEVSGLLSNEDNCNTILSGVPSDENTNVEITSSLRAGATYGKLKIETIRLGGIQDLGNSKRTANLVLIGKKQTSVFKDPSFNERIPVYYAVSTGNTIINCKDNSSVCEEMGGAWRGDHCSFCNSLGGTLQSNNTCSRTP